MSSNQPEITAGLDQQPLPAHRGPPSDPLASQPTSTATTSEAVQTSADSEFDVYRLASVSERRPPSSAVAVQASEADVPEASAAEPQRSHATSVFLSGAKGASLVRICVACPSSTCLTPYPCYAASSRVP